MTEQLRVKGFLHDGGSRGVIRVVMDFAQMSVSLSICTFSFPLQKKPISTKENDFGEDKSDFVQTIDAQLVRSLFLHSGALISCALCTFNSAQNSNLSRRFTCI